METTLICWVHGDPSSFAIDIDRNKTIAHLKNAILTANPNCFNGFDAPQLQLCLLTSPTPKKRGMSSFLRMTMSFRDQIIQDIINDHFKGSLTRKTIHIEDHRFDLIVEPKWIFSISWTVNINTATLNELKEKISKEYYPHLDSTSQEQPEVNRVTLRA
ncbi:hypothetical protein BGX38DRAFT_1334715 [Terfezia claveryi]|nr:hypothetical protein BGX38DRAFT_1334715 [Terfezia claveryi]